MSRKIKPLANQMINELQIIHGAMELGDYNASLSACKRAALITVQLIEEMELTIKQRHANEIAAIKALMPRKGAGTFKVS
jgi:hypothetical protein